MTSSSNSTFAEKFFAFAKLRLAPFLNKHFRNFFVVQSVSLVGSWMQELAKSWIVINLIGREHFGGPTTAVSILLCASAIPSLLLSGFAGSLADKNGARGILLLTQLSLAVLAFSLGMLVFTGSVEYWHLVVFALVEGTVLAFDMPAFALVTPKIVPKDQFQQAMALNSLSFHTSRVVGPALAGLIMSFGTPASVFFINAGSFLGIVFLILKLPLAHTHTSTTSAKPQMREVIVYLKNHPLFLRIFVQFFTIMALVFPLIFTTFRVFLKERFELSEERFGLVFSVPGLGAMLGSLTFLLWNPKNPLKVLPVGIVGLLIGLSVLSFASTLDVAVLALVLFSFSMFLTLGALLVTVQIRVEDRMRGRVSAIIGIAFSAVAPLMSFPISLLADSIGAPKSMQVLAILCGAISAYLAWSSRALKDQTAHLKAPSP